MADPLTFYPHLHTRVTDLIKRQADGRGVAPLTLRLKKNGAEVPGDAKTLDVHLAGPGDVGGLQPGSILLMAPPPFARDAETTKLVHADIRAPDLPWRYSPEGGATRRPWLALLVGTPDEFTVAGGLLTFEPDKAQAVLAAYDFTQAQRWAHVQESPNGAGEPHRIARLVGLRGLPVGEQAAGLLPQTEYTAAIVAAFKPDGQPAWGNGPFPESLSAYHSWTFWTGEEGDFETLATAIQPRPALGLGRVTLNLPRVRDPQSGAPMQLEMRGAIGSLADEPPGGAVLEAARADLTALQTPAQDAPPPGHPARPIIGLPDYDRPWLPDAAAAVWSQDLNNDPRLRGTAGLGGWVGREAQEDLVRAAVQQMGAMNAALQRIAQLALGLEAARGLWNRRLPSANGRRLRVFGPATARLETMGGSVQAAITGDDSPLPQAFFTSAAMRVLRRGTSRTRGADGSPDGAYRPAAALADAANSVPPAPAPALAPPFHMDGIADALGVPRPDDLILTAPFPQQVGRLVARFIGRVIDDGWPNNEFLPEFRELVLEDRLDNLNCGDAVLSHLHRHAGEIATEEIFCEALTACRVEATGLPSQGFAAILANNVFSDLTPGQLGCILSPEPPPADTRRPRDLDLLVDRIGDMLDPNKPRPPGWRRVESTIGGLVLDTLAPQEMPVSIDLPTWTLLNRHDKEWLLPGVGALEKHSVIALKTNPRFVAGFLAGINSQFLGEMHWRNLPVDRTATPLLQFWGQFDYQAQRRQPDILPIGQWDPTKGLGDKRHQWVRPGDPTGREDVVFVFRTDLFRRYPATQVYLSRRTGDGLKLGPDLSAAQAAVAPQARTEMGPIYQGQIEPDLVFFAFDIDPETVDQYQLMLDEPPAELRFRNKRDVNADGAAFAAKTIDLHSRVAFLGSHLEAQGLRVP